MTWHTRVAYNPIVLRAFRVGFRSGPHSFRLWLWGLLLAAILVGFAAHFLLDPEQAPGSGAPLRESMWPTLTFALILFTAANLVLGGLQRMLMAFSQERERGTFDFLHLSTLRSSSILTGFLVAGQLPGYMLLLITLPVMGVGTVLGGGSLVHLLLLLALLSGYVLFLSVFFLTLGFWVQRSSDLRSLALILLVVGCFVLTGLSMNQPQSLLPVLAVFPVLASQWHRCFEGAGTLEIVCFGQPVPVEILAVVLLAPIGVMLYVSLTRCLRQRERPPLTPLASTFVVSWVLVGVTATLWDQTTALATKTIPLVLVAWVLGSWLLAIGTRGAVETIRLLERPRALPWGLDGDAPPYLLAGALALIVPVLLALLARQDGQSWPAASWVFSAPILAHFLLRQWLAWVAPSRQRMGTIAFAMLCVWLPLILQLLLLWWTDGRLDAHFFLQGVASLSPFIALYWLLPGAPAASSSLETWVLVWQGLLVVSVMVLVALHARALARMRPAGPAVDDSLPHDASADPA